MADPAHEFKTVENKLIVLYLLNRMVLPMSRGQIAEMVLSGDFMDFFTLQQALSEMVDIGYLDASQENAADNNTTRYTLTEEGTNTLEFFERRITFSTRQAIIRYANENRQKIQKDYEKTATYFPDENNDEFRVKCGVYEDKRALLELFISVDTREQAKFIQSNWQRNASVLYGRIIDALTTQAPEDSGEENNNSEENEPPLNE
jgi:DNA-binding PadR family transcriptional regulator